MSRGTRGTRAILWMAALALMAGCRAPERMAEPVAPSEAPAAAQPSASGTAPDGWTLRFSDDFERSELGQNWRAVSGDWRIVNGMLAGGTTGGGGDKIIVCTRRFAGAQRLEFDAQSDRPCDLTGILCCDESGYHGGYFFGFGSDNNAHGKLLVEAMYVADYDAVIVPGKLHHVVCQRVGSELKHAIDGEEVLSFVHEPPLTGGQHEMIGFYIWTRGMIDNVKVYTKAED